MSNEAGERRTTGSALHGPRRRIPVAAHVGDYRDYAARVHRAAREAGQGLRREEFVKSVFDWATDERLLLTAFEDLKRFGGPAPGIDGITYDDIPDVFVPRYARDLRDALKTGRFTASELRSVMIPKLSGNGLRELLLAIIDDRVIGKAILLAISPFLDAGFDEHSFGFRPGRDRLHALAYALAVAQREGRWHWAVLDIKDAFPSVPRKRLEQILRNKLPNDRLCSVINQLANNGRPKGIPQGQPLCPLVLNVYLDHILDKPWRRLHLDTPLIRVADDLLILSQNEQEAAAAIKTLQRLVSSAGMQPKGDHAQADRDLRNGEVAHWLGLRVRHDTEKAIVSLGEPSWRKLQDRLEQAQTRVFPTLAADAVVKGWFHCQGVFLGEGELEEAFVRVKALMGDLGLDEPPGDAELLAEVGDGSKRWDLIQRGAIRRLEMPVLPGGSADRHLRFLGQRCRAAGAAPLVGQRFELFTDGSALGPQGPGGWAFLLRSKDQRFQTFDSGNQAVATNNQMELAAVISGLQELPYGADVTVYCDSRYVVDGVNCHLTRWCDLGYLEPAINPKIANPELWYDLAVDLGRLNASFVWIPGHTGIVENDFCDRLAVAAALELMAERDSHV